MKKKQMYAVYVLLAVLLAALSGCGSSAYLRTGSSSDPVVVFETTMGDIFVQLFETEAPEGTANFLEYVNSGFYDGLIFHRVIDGFVIQAGGYDPDLTAAETRDPVVNEATNGLRNLRGTLSYARTDEVNSATSQFFINLENNRSLDHRSSTARGFGYAVFGKVVRGMAVVDKIAQVRTAKRKGMADVPVVPVVITAAYVFEQ